MIDEYEQGVSATIKTRGQLEAEEEGLIRLHDATFTWATDGKPDQFKLRIDDLTFVKGKINLIAGSTGCGKSSLLEVRRDWNRLIVGPYRRTSFREKGGCILPSATSGRCELCGAGKLVHVGDDQGEYPVWRRVGRGAV
jgi:hypothetical protein